MLSSCRESWSCRQAVWPALLLLLTLFVRDDWCTCSLWNIKPGKDFHHLCSLCPHSLPLLMLNCSIEGHVSSLPTFVLASLYDSWSHGHATSLSETFLVLRFIIIWRNKLTYFLEGLAVLFVANMITWGSENRIAYNINWNWCFYVQDSKN